MGDIIAEILETLLSDLIECRRVPKIIRYILLALAIGFLEFIFIAVAIHSETFAGNILGVVLAVATFVLGAYIAIFKIHRN